MDASSKPAVRRHILVLEQDNFLNSLLHLLLYREGFEVSVINNVQNVSPYITQTPAPDLLFVNQSWLLDHDSDLLKLRQEDHPWREVNMIAMIHCYDEERFNRLIRLGVNDILQQPFEPGDLLDIVLKYTASG